MVISIRDHINTKEKLGEGIISGLKSLKN